MSVIEWYKISAAPYSPPDFSTAKSYGNRVTPQVEGKRRYLVV